MSCWQRLLAVMHCDAMLPHLLHVNIKSVKVSNIKNVNFCIKRNNTYLKRVNVIV
jgi:hypothetical protein